jgi:hypothetical protein
MSVLIDISSQPLQGRHALSSVHCHPPFIGQINLSTTQSAMLRSRISPLLQSPSTKAIFRQNFHGIGRHSYSIQIPRLSPVARPFPTKNAFQLTRVFSTTAIIKDNKASAVSTTPQFPIRIDHL